MLLGAHGKDRRYAGVQRNRSAKTQIPLDCPLSGSRKNMRQSKRKDLMDNGKIC